MICFIILRNVQRGEKNLFFLPPWEFQTPLSFRTPGLITCLEIDSLSVTEQVPVNRPWGSGRLLISRKGVIQCRCSQDWLVWVQRPAGCLLPRQMLRQQQHGAFQGNSQQYSVYCFLLEPSQCPNSYKMGRDTTYKWWNISDVMRNFKPVGKLISTYAISLCCQIVHCHLFTTTLNKVGEIAVGGGLTIHSLQLSETLKAIQFY